MVACGENQGIGRADWWLSIVTSEGIKNKKNLIINNIPP
jgi:hypothetical protein